MPPLNPDSALTALLAFTGWTAMHVLLLGFLERIPLLLRGKRRADQFSKSRSYTEDNFVGRMACHHQNCLENLPLFAVVVLVNAFVSISGGESDVSSVASIDHEAWLYVYLRLCQGLVHWYKVSHYAVLVRFYFFAPGLFLLIYMGFKTAGFQMPPIPYL